MMRILMCLVAWFHLGMVMPSLHAEERLVFISSFAAGDKGAIHACRFDLASGSLTMGARTGGVENPFYLALAPDRKHLYAIHAEKFGGKAPEQVAAYEILDDKGRLKLLNRQSALGSAACYLDVDATGKAVLVANYTTGSVAALPVRADSSLGEAASSMQHRDSSVDPARQKEPHAHCIVVSPDNRFALAADLGLDQVLVYRLDASTAKLTAHEPPFARAPAGAGPRHLTFHPGGKWVYVVNELSNSVTRFDYDPTAGTLQQQETISTLPKDFAGKSCCADFKVAPDGHSLYATNRGHDSIAAYRIASDGRLALVQIEPSRGKGPQNLALTADGKWLLCANMPGNNVAVFRIDADSSRLRSAGDPVVLPSPSCIRLLDR
jgi:6-phosphogluconolactonase